MGIVCPATLHDIVDVPLVNPRDGLRRGREEGLRVGLRRGRLGRQGGLWGVEDAQVRYR